MPEGRRQHTARAPARSDRRHEARPSRPRMPPAASPCSAEGRGSATTRETRAAPLARLPELGILVR